MIFVVDGFIHDRATVGAHTGAAGEFDGEVEPGEDENEDHEQWNKPGIKGHNCLRSLLGFDCPGNVPQRPGKGKYFKEGQCTDGLVASSPGLDRSAHSADDTPDCEDDPGAFRLTQGGLSMEYFTRLPE